MAVLLLLSVALLTAYFRESDSGVVHSVQGGLLTIVAAAPERHATVTKPFRDGWNWTATSSAPSLRTRRSRRRSSSCAPPSPRAHDPGRERAAAGAARLPAGPRCSPRPEARPGARDRPLDHRLVLHRDHQRRQQRRRGGLRRGGERAGSRRPRHKVNVDRLAGQLITDQQSFVDAMVEPGAARRPGHRRGSVTGDLTLQYVDKSEKVKVGQFVVTSGSKARCSSGASPSARWRASARRRSSCTRPSPSSPFVDFRKLDLVAVVTR